MGQHRKPRATKLFAVSATLHVAPLPSQIIGMPRRLGGNYAGGERIEGASGDG